jgi:hypothetical protein
MVDKKSTTYLEYSRYLESNFVKKEVVKLNETKLLSEFGEELQNVLASFYDHTESNIKRTGSMFNGIYTQQNGVFMMSFRIFRELVAADFKNHGLKSCTDHDYNQIMSDLLSKNIIMKIRKQKGQRSALFRLILPFYLKPLYNTVGKDVVDAKDDKNIEWYDATNPAGGEKTTMTEAERELLNKAKQIAKAKRESNAT